MLATQLNEIAQSISVELYLDALLSRSNIASQRLAIDWLFKQCGIEDANFCEVMNVVSTIFGQEVQAKKAKDQPKKTVPKSGKVEIPKHKGSELK